MHDLFAKRRQLATAVVQCTSTNLYLLRTRTAKTDIVALQLQQTIAGDAAGTLQRSCGDLQPVASCMINAAATVFQCVGNNIQIAIAGQSAICVVQRVVNVQRCCIGTCSDQLAAVVAQILTADIQCAIAAQGPAAVVQRTRHLQAHYLCTGCRKRSTCGNQIACLHIYPMRRSVAATKVGDIPAQQQTAIADDVATLALQVRSADMQPAIAGLLHIACGIAEVLRTDFEIAITGQ
nr:hypothetical protein [Stenotrophomonas ginsengisoli]